MSFGILVLAPNCVIIKPEEWALFVDSIEIGLVAGWTGYHVAQNICLHCYGTSCGTNVSVKMDRMKTMSVDGQRTRSPLATATTFLANPLVIGPNVTCCDGWRHVASNDSRGRSRSRTIDSILFAFQPDA